MNDNEFETYLKDRYENQRQWYENKARFNKNWNTTLQLTLIALTSMTPLLIIIDIIFQEFPILRVLSVITSILIAFIAPTIRFLKFQEKWVNYRSVAELLKKEQYYFKANINEYGKAQDKQKLFVERIENLISQAHTSWVAEYRFRAEPEK